jgi:hypothetical protein
MKRSSILFAGAGLELAFAIWNFVDDYAGFQEGSTSPYSFAQSVVPWAGLSVILFFSARRARVREAGEA